MTSRRITFFHRSLYTYMHKQYRGQPGRRYPPMSSHKFGTFDFKKENKLKNESFHFCLLIRLFWKPSKSSSSKIEFCGPDIGTKCLARDVGYILQFRT